MQTPKVRRGAVVVLACVMIIAGALACGAGDDETAQYGVELERINGVATNNMVDLEVVKARFDRLENENRALADRVAELEEENRELTHRISVLETAGPAGGGANPAPASAAISPGTIPSEMAATDEDRQLVRDFAECSLKMAGEIPDNLLSGMANELARQMWQEIEDGTTTIVQVRMGYNLLCGGQ